MSRVLVLLLCVLAIQSSVESAGLVYDYYAKTCPQAEQIIHDTVYKLYEKKGNIATSLIRFVFHDCFNVRTYLHHLYICISVSMIFRASEIYGFY